MSFSNNVKNEIRENYKTLAQNSKRIADAFLHCGNVQNPDKEYHLEFVFQSLFQAEELLETLMDLDIISGLTERKGNYVVYIKNSTAIEDFLAAVGATMSAVEVMNVKVYKDLRNNANRIANCDTANIDRAVQAAQKQVADIEYIKAAKGLDFLPEDLRVLAQTRLENPDMSLTELAKNRTVSKSTVQYRMNKISVIANEIRTGTLL